MREHFWEAIRKPYFKGVGKVNLDARSTIPKAVQMVAAPDECVSMMCNTCGFDHECI